MVQQSRALGGAGIAALLLVGSTTVQAAALVHFNGLIPITCYIDTVGTLVSGVLAEVGSKLTSLAGGGQSATVTSHCNTWFFTVILDGPFEVSVAAPADQLQYSATVKHHPWGFTNTQDFPLGSGPRSLFFWVAGYQDITIDMEADFSTSYVAVPGGNYSYKVTVSLVPP
jgi:hypothetical protein